MIKAIFFDLDGTLLPMKEEEFAKVYFSSLSQKMIPYGYETEKLITTILNGTKAMFLNDGKMTNEQVFWNYFESVYGKEKLKDKPIFDHFYENEFKKTKSECKENPLARSIVDFCHENFQYVILSTNPIFPLVGTLTRMSFVHLKKEDFDWITSYENSCFTKPNPKYFMEILNHFHLEPQEVLLFGNNTYEDGECALAAHIKCYLVGDYIIESPHSTHHFLKLKMTDIIPLLKTYIK